MDDRLVKAQNNHIDERKADARESADTTLESSKERRRMFREFTQEALPTPPDLPGWHYCWLSTTNQYDPIYKRVRMGYEPVKADDIPEFTHLRLKSGEYENCVSVNEMILFKLPQEIYQEIMEEYHHLRPLEEEARIKANALPNERDSHGRPLGQIEGDGISGLGSHVKTPVFN